MLGSQLSSQPEDCSPEGCSAAEELARAVWSVLEAGMEIVLYPAFGWSETLRCVRSTEVRAATYIAVQEEEGFRAGMEVQLAHIAPALVRFMHVFKVMSAILKLCHQKQ